MRVDGSCLLLAQVDQCHRPDAESTGSAAQLRGSATPTLEGMQSTRETLGPVLRELGEQVLQSCYHSLSCVGRLSPSETEVRVESQGIVHLGIRTEHCVCVGRKLKPFVHRSSARFVGCRWRFLVELIYRSRSPPGGVVETLESVTPASPRPSLSFRRS